MGRVYNAFLRAAEEQQTDEPQKDSVDRRPDEGRVDAVGESFPAEGPFERLTFTGQQTTGDKSSPPLLLALPHGAVPDRAAHLVADTPAPFPEAKGGDGAAELSRDPQSPASALPDREAGEKYQLGNLFSLIPQSIPLSGRVVLPYS
jgi:hypothetical protein